MEVAYRAHFAKDLQKIKDKNLLNAVGDVINSVKSAETLQTISNVKKMKGIPYQDWRIPSRLLFDP